MIAKYNENNYHAYKKNGKIGIATHFQEKCLDGFQESWDRLAMYMIVEIEDLDQLYDINFFVEYEDDSPTNTKHQMQWCVNESVPIFPDPNIDKGEVGLVLSTSSRSDDWYQADKYYCTKVVNLKDCKRIWVEYWYYKYDGNVYDRKNPYKEAKEVSIEEFIDLMVSSRAENM